MQQMRLGIARFSSKQARKEGNDMNGVSEGDDRQADVLAAGITYFAILKTPDPLRR